MIKKIVLYVVAGLVGLLFSSQVMAQSIVGGGGWGGNVGNNPWYNMGVNMRDKCPSSNNNCDSGINCSCNGMNTCPYGTFYKTMSSYIQDNQNACWFCDAFYKDSSSTSGSGTGTGTGGSSSESGLFPAINQLATYIYNNLAKTFGSFMGLGILFFLLFHVGKMLVSFKEVDLTQFLDDMLRPLGRAIIAAALLGLTTTSISFEIFHGLTNPIFMASASIGNEIMKTSLNNVEYLQHGITGFSSSGGSTSTTTWQFNSETCNTAITTADTNETTSVLSKAQGKVLRCWMEQVSSSFITGIAIGGTLIRVSIGKIFSDGLPMFLVGLTLWLGFWILYLMFPFKVLDAFIKFAFVMTLMPLWITLWVFPKTQQYTKKAWEMFLGACLQLMILSLMISLTLILIQNAIPQTARENLLTCLRAGLDQAALSWISFGSGAILNTIAFTAMGWALLGQAAPLANSFIGGGANINTNIGNSMAGTMGQVGVLAWAGSKATAKFGYWGAGKTKDLTLKGLDKAATPGAGKRASKLNRFFEGVRHPIDRVFGGGRPTFTPPGTLGADFGKLTSKAQTNVDSGVMADKNKIERLATSGLLGDQRALQEMKDKAKTTTEKEIYENMMRSAEHGKGISDADVKALKDERARQEMQAHPLSEADIMAKMNADDLKKRDEVADSRKEFANKKALYNRQTTDRFGDYEDAAKLESESDYNRRVEFMCGSDAEKQALKQLRTAAQENGAVITAEAKAQFIENMSMAKTMASLPDASAYQRTDAAAVSWASNANYITATENLQNDMTLMLRSLNTATSREEYATMIENTAFQSSEAKMVKRYADQMWDARELGDKQVSRVTKGFVKNFMMANGENPENSELLADQVAATSVKGIMTGDDTALASSVGALRKR